MSGIAKRFGATQALREVDLTVRKGEVHALIGENGAGKSTLMKILSGACKPDRGVIELNGQSLLLKNPQEARRRGISMVYQELNLAPELNVEENLLLGHEPGKFGWIKRKERRRIARQALSFVRHEDLPLHYPVSRLSLPQRQLVEIARALVGSAKILILDEPTSSLSRVDAKILFGIIGKLKEEGVSVIYISHFLEECKGVADRFTVLRDGKTVGKGEMKAVEKKELIHLMVGRDITEVFPAFPPALGKTILEAQNLEGRNYPRNVSFKLHAGEIFGIAGLVGAGRSETVRACFGLDKIKKGKVLIFDREKTNGSPRDRLRDGIGFLSENRKEEGLFQNRDLADNLTLTNLKAFSRWGIINGEAQHAMAAKWIRELKVKATGIRQTVSELSGGNQQKLALGRLLHHKAEIYLLDEPTRGIDVVSKTHIYGIIRQLAADRKGILLISSYLPELLGLCHTIGVMCRGVMAKVQPAGKWTEHGIISIATGERS